MTATPQSLHLQECGEAPKTSGCHIVNRLTGHSEIGVGPSRGGVPRILLCWTRYLLGMKILVRQRANRVCPPHSGAASREGDRPAEAAQIRFLSLLCNVVWQHQRTLNPKQECLRRPRHLDALVVSFQDRLLRGHVYPMGNITAWRFWGWLDDESCWRREARLQVYK